MILERAALLHFYLLFKCKQVSHHGLRITLIRSVGRSAIFNSRRQHLSAKLSSF
jgi:hypothetical protein